MTYSSRRLCVFVTKKFLSPCFHRCNHTGSPQTAIYIAGTLLNLPLLLGAKRTCLPQAGLSASGGDPACGAAGHLSFNLKTICSPSRGSVAIGQNCHSGRALQACPVLDTGLGETRNPGSYRKIQSLWIPRRLWRGMTNCETASRRRGI